MAYVEVFHKGARKRLVELSGADMVVGRDPAAQLVLDDDLVSRRHARLYIDAARYFVQDLGTTNGLYVNGKRAYNEPLREGDRLEFGTFVLVYHEGPSDAARTLPAGASAFASGDVKDTGSASPKQMAELRQRMRTLMEPHLEQVGADNVWALKHRETDVGAGDGCEVRLAGFEKDKAAVVERRDDGSFCVRKAGLFGTVVVNGKKVAAQDLKDGDEIAVGKVKLRFRLGAP